MRCTKNKNKKVISKSKSTTTLYRFTFRATLLWATDFGTNDDFTRRYFIETTRTEPKPARCTRTLALFASVCAPVRIFRLLSRQPHMCRFESESCSKRERERGRLAFSEESARLRLDSNSVPCGLQNFSNHAISKFGSFCLLWLDLVRDLSPLSLSGNRNRVPLL